MKKGTPYYLLSALALFGALIAGFTSQSTNDQSDGQRDITTIIQIDDAKTEYPQTVDEQATAFDALRRLQEQGEIELGSTDYDFGTLVDSINGVGEDTNDGKFWIYYINGDTATEGASSYIVQDGDEIIWNYESEQ